MLQENIIERLMSKKSSGHMRTDCINLPTLSTRMIPDEGRVNDALLGVLFNTDSES